MLELDHIVVAATTLVEGQHHIEAALGVTLQRGGQHEFMGTHNMLLKLGDACYLEVIAIDPSLKAPSRPRWFALDDPRTRVQLQSGPKLIHWVIRTADIAAAATSLGALCGPIVAANRGDLHWQITIPEDGSMPMSGACPTLIQWSEGPHVATRMQDQSCRLHHLEICHPQATDLQRTFKNALDDNRVLFATERAPRFKAVFETPNGRRELS